MLKLVAETHGVSDGVMVEADILEVEFGDEERDWEAAWEVYINWVSWMRRGIENVLDFDNPITKEGWSVRPCNIQTLTMVYESDEA